jgi:hypothetical protein
MKWCLMNILKILSFKHRGLYNYHCVQNIYFDVKKIGRHRRNLCAGRETGQGTAGQGGDDVRVADGEGQVGVKE